MAEPKRRQGQKKQNGKKAIPKEICPKCGEYLRTASMRGSVEQNRAYVRVGLCCPSLTCDYIVKDMVEIGDTEETEEK